MRICWHLILSIAILALAGHASAQDNITVGGQVRPRFEFRNPGAGSADSFTSMRLRAHVTAKKDRNTSVFIQIQDVRLWGEETNTLSDFRADNFDLHQGYADINNIGGSPLSIRAGRQEINLGGQRLVGAVGWTQQGRSFDGLQISAAADKGRVDVLAFRLADTSAGTITNPIPNNAALVGAQGTITAMNSATLELYALYNAIWGAANTDQVTIGARYAASRTQWIYRIESSFQTGTRGGQDVTAFMFGTRIGYKRPKGSVTVWYDYLSGDDDPTDGKTKVFDTLFATNHKFYGFYDLFLNIPVHTGGLGLQDIALKTSVTPRPEVTLGLDFHSFMLAKKGALSSGHLGEEADLTLTYRYTKGVALVAGFAYVIQDDALATVRGLTKNASWGYMMANVTF